MNLGYARLVYRRNFTRPYFDPDRGVIYDCFMQMGE